ncbi:MAG: hypothetical protein R2770_00725 [Acidimicrobiales bacterium]
MGSFAFDYVARQKVAGIHLRAFTLKQLPVPGPDQVADLGQILTAAIAELAATSWDTSLLRRSLGAPDPPSLWNETRRELLRAELDAAFFHIYGMARHDVDYIMDTFPIVRRKDEGEYSEYRTKRLILEVYDRMAEAITSGQPYETLLDPPPADPSLCHDPSTRPDWADLYLPSD